MFLPIVGVLLVVCGATFSFCIAGRLGKKILIKFAAIGGIAIVAVAAMLLMNETPVTQKVMLYWVFGPALLVYFFGVLCGFIGLIAYEKFSQKAKSKDID